MASHKTSGFSSPYLEEYYCMGNIFNTNDTDANNILQLNREEFKIGNLISQGTYATVIQAESAKNRKLAIKHISNVQKNSEATKKVVRELFLLHSLQADCIVSLVDIKIASNHINIVMDHYDYNLHGIIYKGLNDFKGPKMPFSKKSDFLILLRQILCAVRYLHVSGVIHRNLKPTNILLDSNLNVKLCEFGYARSILDSEEGMDARGEVGTVDDGHHWYMSPEVLLMPDQCGPAQDVWAVACIFGEFIQAAPLFPGQDEQHQLIAIVSRLGEMSRRDVDFVKSSEKKRWVESLQSTGVSLIQSLSEANGIHPDLLPSIMSMLEFNPKRRISCDDALSLPLFHTLPPLSLSLPLPLSDAPPSKLSQYSERLLHTVDSIKTRSARFAIVDAVVKDIILQLALSEAPIRGASDSEDGYDSESSGRFPPIRATVSSKQAGLCAPDCAAYEMHAELHAAINAHRNIKSSRKESVVGRKSSVSLLQPVNTAVRAVSGDTTTDKRGSIGYIAATNEERLRTSFVSNRAPRGSRLSQISVASRSSISSATRSPSVSSIDRQTVFTPKRTESVSKRHL